MRHRNSASSLFIYVIMKRIEKDAIGKKLLDFLTELILIRTIYTEELKSLKHVFK